MEDDVIPGGRNVDLRLIGVMLVLRKSTKRRLEWLPHVCSGPAPTATVRARP